MERKRVLTSDDIMDMPGTYFNPITEITVTVDDSQYIDLTQVNLDNYSGNEWILVSEDPLNDSSAIGEHLREEVELEGGLMATNEISETAEEQQD